MIEFGGVRGTRTAGNATFTLNGGQVPSAAGGVVFFHVGSMGGSATFTINGGIAAGALPGLVFFDSGSDAEDATLITKGGLAGGPGGSIRFDHDGRGGKARVELLGNGTLDMSFHDGPNLTIGSVEGTGAAFLGSINLSVGANNLDTTLSGVVRDGGVFGGTGGSLTKVGTGTLILGSANTYTGGTSVLNGQLLVTNTRGSATGPGALLVSRGRLAGTGTIAGAVTLGIGSGGGAFLSPGANKARSLGILTIESALTLHADATYDFQLDSNSVAADQVAANGITIESGAQFAPVDLGTGNLRLGTEFEVLDNASATPIAATFTNLADGSTITIGNSTFQANYEGGDGNDLTLTVVP